MTQTGELLATFKHQARLLRRTQRRLTQALLHGSPASSPVFFANSFPKSGTHLLTQVIGGFTRLGPAVDSGLPAVVTFDGFTGRRRTPQEIMADLRRFLPGDIGYGHVHAFPEALAWMSRANWATFFILRDPRDVVVSHVHYIAEMAPNHIHHRYYHEVLQSFDERLQASIQGAPVEALALAEPGKPAFEPLPDIRSRFEPFLGWLERPEILTLRYEEFITDRRATLEKVLEHAIEHDFKPAVTWDRALQILDAAIDPARSPTFRSGKTGDWRNQFNAENEALFEAVAGDLLIQLGYA